jgi:hypothetical protein
MRRVRGGAWILLLVPALLVALFSIGAVFIGVEENEFEMSTGVAWTEVEETTPSIASYIVRLERLIGVGYGVVGFTWGAIALRMLRKGQREAWFILWSMPMVFGAAAAVFFIDGAGGLATYYAGYTLMALIGLILSYPRAEPSDM